MVLARGLSLWLPTLLPNPELAPLLATQPIPPAPLYLLFGMGAASTLIALCLWLGRALPEVVLAAGLFALAALLFANLWSQHFERGPLEWLMRRLCG